MYDFYLDDTEKGMRGKGYLPILGGFIMEYNRYPELQNDLWILKERFGLNKFDAIKWSPGQTDQTYRAQRRIPDQNLFRRSVLELLGNYNVTLIISVIDEDELIRRGSLKYYRSQALEHLSQRFQLFLQDKKVKGQNWGQIILDYPGHEKESFLSKYYRDICCFGCKHTEMQLRLLSKTLYLAHAFSCEGLQLADYVVGMMGYTLKNQDKRYYDLVRNKIRNYKGKIKGAGIIIFPSNSKKIDFLFQ